jgi:cardiolipin synthase
MATLINAIPNSLSVLRIVLLIPLVYFIKNIDIINTVVFSLLIIVTDYLDGFLARRWNVISKTGKILDPVADKICITTVGVALTVYRGFPLYLLIALILRDVIILLAAFFTIVKLDDVPASNITGKITAGVVSFCLLVFLFDIDPLKVPFIAAVVFMIPTSLLSYGFRILQKFRSRKKNG